MDPEGSSSSPHDFGFAFNDSNFSDRLLHIEIVHGSPSLEGCAPTVSEGARRKIIPSNAIKTDLWQNASWFGCFQYSFAWLMRKWGKLDEDNGMDCENEETGSVAMVEESPSGCEDDTQSNDSIWSMEHFVIVKTLPLFSNGMRDSEQQDITLRINASEEGAFMEILNFIYCNTLSATTRSALLGVLVVADKFDVASCMRCCVQLLVKLPMTVESALSYLELPSSVLAGKDVHKLTDAAREYLSARYKNISEFEEELFSLPLAGIEAIFSSDDLQVTSEDAAYDFISKWASNWYPKLEERKELFSSRIGRLIRFPYLTCPKLKEVLTCDNFDDELAREAVLEALFFKAQTLHQQQFSSADISASARRRFLERAYKYRPVRVVELGHPRKQCVAFLDLKRLELEDISRRGGYILRRSSWTGMASFF